ncbi:MAG: hypothetical protein HY328_15830 [Chloroflexi bacterium]|nr:hypothetical protein [Chloroflexota bacterium]
MRIIGEVVIPPDKLSRYLLVWRPKSDKSQFLAQAGFTTQNTTDLDRALRRLVIENDAIPDRRDEYGQFVQIEGLLTGPSATLHVVIVWIRPANDARFRFVTLKPAR